MGSAAKRTDPSASLQRLHLVHPTLFMAPEHLSDVTAWHGHIPFAFWCMEALQPRVFVELGTHKGDSYFAFCQAVERLSSATVCYAVDSWLGDEHAGTYGSEVHAAVLRHNEQKYAHFSRLIRSTFDEALTRFSDGAIDLLHLDGLHTYDAVRHDFESWLPKLSPCGVVLFHDIGVRERGFGVWRLWEELSARYPHFAFTHSHGLGVLAVGAHAPAAVRSLCGLDPDGTEQARTVFARLGDAVLATSGQHRVQARLDAALERIAESDKLALARQGELADKSALVAELSAQAGDFRAAVSEKDGRLAALRKEIAAIKLALAQQQALVAAHAMDIAEKRLVIHSLLKILRPAGLRARLSPRRIANRVRRSPAMLPFELAYGLLRGRLRAQLRRLREERIIRASGLFDDGYYLQKSPDVIEQGIDPVRHYVESGAAEGRDPHPLFHTSYYLEQNPDVAESGINPLAHYIVQGAWEGRKPMPAFDSAYYLRRYPDVAEARVNPLGHYVWFGAAEGRSPMPLFDTAYYLKHNPEVAQTGLNPLVHYLLHGWKEGRNPHPQFDTAAYLEHYPEAVQSGLDPLAHYLSSGEEQDWTAYWADPSAVRDTPQRRLLAKSLPLAEPRLGLLPQVQVTVIVPVYRGFEETRRCLDSVLAASNVTRAHVLVINDKSPDKALTRTLEEQAAAGRFELLTNDANLGFVQTVNRGMSARPADDVILLNSDTEVADEWIDRLVVHAYAAPRIGTVTPFSNNATICSYPSLPGGPSLPAGETLQSLDLACRQANFGRSVDIPTAVGFCMYIRRECLDQVGLFDAETFGRGYGEENDFCMRAANAHWRHLLAADTFVFHCGEVSFGAAAQEVKDRAMQKLLALHPTYTEVVSKHVREDPAKPLRIAATVMRFRLGPLPVVLQILHSLGGGTEQHAGEVAAVLKGRARILTLVPFEGGLLLRGGEAEDPVNLRFSMPWDYDLLVKMLSAFGLARVHVHHVLGYPIDVRRLVIDLGVPLDFTVHDYFSVCPLINMVSPDHEYCGEPRESSCNACIAERPAFGANDIDSWRAKHAWLFQDAERVLCPSADVARRIGRYHPQANLVVVPHLEALPYPEVARPRRVTANRPLRIAVLGEMVALKGIARVIAAAQRARETQAPLEFMVIGRASPETVVRLRKWGVQKITGPYRKDDLPAILGRLAPDVVWFPVQCPETFSFTLSEAKTAGLPVVVPNLGSFPERVAGRPWSWQMPWDLQTPQVVEFFTRIRSENFQADTPPVPPPSVPGPGVATVSGREFYESRYLDRNQEAPLAGA